MMRRMTRDYARRTPKAPARRQRTRPSSGKRRSKPASSHSFSAPSFSAGVILGAVLMLLASLAPRAFEEAESVVRQGMAAPAGEIEIEFDFPELLEEDTVEVDPNAYPVEFPEEDPAAGPRVYMIQAASLKEASRASTLTAELEAAGLAARWDRVDLPSGVWFRVMVGPIEGTVEATRALTELRRRNLGAHLIPLG